MRLAILAAAALQASASGVIDVCCGCGESPAQGLQKLANTLGAHTLRLNGICQLNETWAFGANNGGTSSQPVTIVGGPGAAVIGGSALSMSDFVPVTDASILAQLPAIARSNVMELDLTAAGIILRPEQTTFPCQPYLGGDASIVLDVLFPSVVELMWGPDPLSAMPLTPARYPNDAGVASSSWAPIVSKPNASDNLYFGSDAAFAAHMATWANQLNTDPSSIQLRIFTQPLGWASQITPLQAFNMPSASSNGSVRSDYCQIYPSGEQVPLVGGRFHVFNVLAELDEPGEYYFNRTSNKMYVWPPSTSSFGSVSADAQAADTTVAFVSLIEDLIAVNNASYIIFEELAFGITRGAAFNVVNSSYISILNSNVKSTGNMGVNITGGQYVNFVSSNVTYTGNGGIFSTAGDRNTLTSSYNSIVNCTIQHFNRYQICYVPGVAFAGVGNSVVGSDIGFGPHQGIFLAGNNHMVDNNYIHDLAQITSDSGAIYSGRDWTYRGTQISSNTFLNINTAFDPSNNVQAIYLDDLVSGYNIQNNVFINVSRAYHLGGGRDNLFINNTIYNPLPNGMHAVVHVDDRGEGWDKSACAPGGVLYKFLARVPYNTSDAWIHMYPDLPNILNDVPCRAKYNIIENNSVCNMPNGTSFFDATPSTFQSWGSLMFNNDVNASC